MLSLPPDKRIVTKARELVVEDGVRNVSDMKVHLKHFVRAELFKDRSLPHPSNRRYFPTDKDIYNMIYR